MNLWDRFLEHVTYNLHLKETLLLGLETFKERGIGKLEPVVIDSFKSVAGLGLRDLLNELLEVTTISAKLEAVQVKDVCDIVVEEAGVVRNDDWNIKY